MRGLGPTPVNTGNISCIGELLEHVSAFTSLGSLITTTGGTDEDVEARCRRHKLHSSFSHMEIKVHLTVDKIFNSKAKSVLLNRSETDKEDHHSTSDLY